MVPKNLYNDLLNTKNINYNFEKQDMDQKMESDVDIVQMKLPSSIRIQSKQFDPNTYEIEPEIKFTNVSTSEIMHPKPGFVDYLIHLFEF